MLIVSIPKSASTSISCTLSKVHKIERDASVFISETVPPQYNLLGEIHRSVREYDVHFLNHISSSRKISHYHIPPTKNNLNLLKKTPKIVVLREPTKIPGAYFREVKSGFRKLPRIFKDCNEESDWSQRATEIGLGSELECFFETWESAASENTKIIHFEDLCDASKVKSILRDIEIFFDLPFSNCSEIERKRFTSAQHGSLHKFTRVFEVLWNKF